MNNIFKSSKQIWRCEVQFYVTGHKKLKAQNPYGCPNSGNIASHFSKHYSEALYDQCGVHVVLTQQVTTTSFQMLIYSN